MERSGKGLDRDAQDFKGIENELDLQNSGML